MLYSTVCCAGTQVYNIIEAHAELDAIYRPKLAIYLPTCVLKVQTRLEAFS